MTDSPLEEIRRQLRLPVAPRAAFARTLLERLEAERAGPAVSAEELDAERGEELPLREAMSVIIPDPLTPVDPCPLPGDVELHTDPGQPT